MNKQLKYFFFLFFVINQIKAQDYNLSWNKSRDTIFKPIKVKISDSFRIVSISKNKKDSILSDYNLSLNEKSFEKINKVKTFLISNVDTNTKSFKKLDEKFNEFYDNFLFYQKPSNDTTIKSGSTNTGNGNPNDTLTKKNAVDLNGDTTNTKNPIVIFIDNCLSEVNIVYSTIALIVALLLGVVIGLAFKKRKPIKTVNISIPKNDINVTMNDTFPVFPDTFKNAFRISEADFKQNSRVFFDTLTRKYLESEEKINAVKFELDQVRADINNQKRESENKSQELNKSLTEREKTINALKVQLENAISLIKSKENKITEELEKSKENIEFGNKLLQKYYAGLYNELKQNPNISKEKAESIIVSNLFAIAFLAISYFKLQIQDYQEGDKANFHLMLGKDSSNQSKIVNETSSKMSVDAIAYYVYHLLQTYQIDGMGNIVISGYKIGK